MVHYINLGGRERPFTLVYSVPFDYEMEYEGRFYNTDVAELVAQMMNAAASMGEAQKRLLEDKESNYTKIIGLISQANSVGLSVVRLVNILYIALKVGHRIAGEPVDFTKQDVADWIGGNTDAVTKFTIVLLHANFNLSGGASDETGDKASESERKKKKQAR